VTERKEFDTKADAVAVREARDDATTTTSTTVSSTTTTTVPGAADGGRPRSRARDGAIKARSALARYRRNRELSLGVLALIITGGGYVLLGLSTAPAIPAGTAALFAVLIGLFGAAHLAVRRFAPRGRRDAVADREPAARHRVRDADPSGPAPRPRRAGQHPIYVAPTQAVLDRRGHRRVRAHPRVRAQRTVAQRYKVTRSYCSAWARCLLPLVPGLGATINGARSGSGVGGFTIQPGRSQVLARDLLRRVPGGERELLSSGSRRLGRLYRPTRQHLGPAAGAVGAFDPIQRRAPLMVAPSPGTRGRSNAPTPSSRNVYLYR